MNMQPRALPFAQYVEGIVRLLDSVSYNDTNYTSDERLTRLKNVYAATAQFFADPEQQAVISKQVKQKKMDAVMRTSVQVTVYCWPKCSETVQTAISIYFVYIVILDDSSQGPDANMDGFATDLLKGRQQQHPFWRLMTPFLEQFLPLYGPFCSMAILRSTFDYFHGCWIETRNFGGFKGSDYFPLFLRRLNGLGGICGGSLFPKDSVDEQKHFEEIATAIAQIEPMVAFFNDLFSFYKEWDEPRDAINLVNSVANVEGIELEAAFERLIVDTIHSSERLLAVFKDSGSAEIKEIINAFVQGYCTWHFCDTRFRMEEVFKKAESVPYGEQFRRYYQHAMSIGSPRIEDWAPSGATFIKRSVVDTQGHASWHGMNGVNGVNGINGANGLKT